MRLVEPFWKPLAKVCVTLVCTLLPGSPKADGLSALHGWQPVPLVMGLEAPVFARSGAGRGSSTSLGPAFEDQAGAGLALSLGRSEGVTGAHGGLMRQGSWLLADGPHPRGEIRIASTVASEQAMQLDIHVSGGSGMTTIEHQTISPGLAGNESRTLAWSPEEQGGSFILAHVSGGSGQSAGVAGRVSSNGVLIAADGDLALLQPSQDLRLRRTVRWQTAEWDGTALLDSRGGAGLRIVIGGQDMTERFVRQTSFGLSPSRVSLSRAQQGRVTALDAALGLGMTYPLGPRSRVGGALDLGIRSMHGRIETRDHLRVGTLAEVDGPRASYRVRTTAPTAAWRLMLEHAPARHTRLVAGAAMVVQPGMPYLVSQRTGNGLAVSQADGQLEVTGDGQPTWRHQVESRQLHHWQLFAGWETRF